MKINNIATVLFIEAAAATISQQDVKTCLGEHLGRLNKPQAMRLDSVHVKHRSATAAGPETKSAAVAIVIGDLLYLFFDCHT
jgi:hypothetical protein